ncbi:MAG: hypothetical protein KC425_17010 [Anaerolineales bacterium]|nr:hypothetical protein [Anaerolineales bacterium]
MMVDGRVTTPMNNLQPPNWQARAAAFAQNRNLTYVPGVYALDLMSELGEVAKEILLATDYGQTPPRFRPELADELGDVLYSLCQLATAAHVDLEAAFTATLAKYEARWQSDGQLGSR